MFDLSAGYYAFDDINHTVVDMVGRELARLPGPPRLLDVGCGRGQLGAALRGLGCRVVGIEANPEALAAAAPRLDEVLAADLTDGAAIGSSLAGRRFDLVLFADVLEHVGDPLAVLRLYTGYLAPGGRIVVSLPNIASWDRRLALLCGRFDYADSGIMDRTHLRFFTFRTAELLVREAGLTPLAVGHAAGIARPFWPLLRRLMFRGGGASDPGAVLRSPAYRLYERRLLPLEQAIAGLRRQLLSFRIVIVAAEAEHG
ncbi:MAG: class I SAM-dependent methyltransferase [Dongiaceae bacterium]